MDTRLANLAGDTLEEEVIGAVERGIQRIRAPRNHRFGSWPTSDYPYQILRPHDRRSIAK
jgi:hypothetical protein